MYSDRDEYVDGYGWNDVKFLSEDRNFEILSKHFIDVIKRRICIAIEMSMLRGIDIFTVAIIQKYPLFIVRLDLEIGA